MNKFAIIAFFVLLGVVGIGIYAFTVQKNNHSGNVTPTNTPASITQTVGSISTSPTVSISTNMNSCLPSDVKLTDIVSADVVSYSVSSGYTIKKVTVEQKLTGLHASCNINGKLVDNTRKEITFYHLTGCWGNAPQNYQDILAKQQQELAQLNQHSTVIQMTCNPSGTPRS